MQIKHASSYIRKIRDNVFGLTQIEIELFPNSGVTLYSVGNK